MFVSAGNVFFGVALAIVSLEPIMTALFYNVCARLLPTPGPTPAPTHIPFSVCHQLIQLSLSIPSCGYSPDYSACVRAAGVCASVRPPAVFLGQFFFPSRRLGDELPTWGMDTPLPSAN